MAPLVVNEEEEGEDGEEEEGDDADHHQEAAVHQAGLSSAPHSPLTPELLVTG